jgi:hypothetical protein
MKDVAVIPISKTGSEIDLIDKAAMGRSAEILEKDKIVIVKIPLAIGKLIQIKPDVREADEEEKANFRDAGLDQDISRTGIAAFLKQNTSSGTFKLVIEIDIDTKVPGTGPEDKTKLHDAK